MTNLNYSHKEIKHCCFFFPLQSLVLISKLPYIHFFHTVLKQIAPEYFEKNEPYLEAGKLNIVWVMFLYKGVLKFLLEISGKRSVKNFEGYLMERYQTTLLAYLPTNNTEPIFYYLLLKYRWCLFFG